MSEVQRFEMPNGSVVFYRDKSHSYWQSYDPKKDTCSGRVGGASSIAKHDGDTSADGLMGWAAGLTCEGIAREIVRSRSLHWLGSKEDIQDWLKRQKLTWRDLRDEAGDRGTQAHNVWEALAEGDTPVLETMYDHGAFKWWGFAQPEVVHAEQVVFSELHGYAGRFDLLAWIDDELTLCDLKTSKYISNSYAVQLNLYSLAMKECGFPRPSKLLIVQVTAEGEFLPIEVPIRETWALNAIRAAAMGREITAHIKAEKKLAAAA